MSDIAHDDECQCPACEPTFFDRLASLCGPEIADAMREKDDDRQADLIQALASMLGRTIARAANGEAALIDVLLTGAEQMMAEEAAGMAGVIAFVKAKRDTNA